MITRKELKELLKDMWIDVNENTGMLIIGYYTNTVGTDKEESVLFESIDDNIEFLEGALSYAKSIKNNKKVN